VYVKSSPALLSFGKGSFAVLCPVLGTNFQEGPGSTRENAENSNCRSRKCDLWRKA